MFECLDSGWIKDIEFPVIDEIRRVLAVFRCMGCEGKARSSLVGYWLVSSRRHTFLGRQYRQSQGNGGMC